ncbi:starvation-inducible DNA-binding protein [Cohaesibacter sp. ES.047]|uniref:Dps family protein n=1 Tax=Cohaesibacter sp. ES.047 TaxID=1798205 RepID=UPI000BB97191|nr:DNA starvation/stationary phase protection protein [Cohaesibacter sp. ES.047]SNY91312.1 starvation-inducible DNA-binding protein [Cohaesibacter sp. ES.047]
MSTSQAVLQIQPHSTAINTGLDETYRKDISEALSDILGGTYKLTIISHIYHWNVVGPLFKSLHELTEDHYNDLFAAADVIAERIRALDSLAPVKQVSFDTFVPESGDIKERKAYDMIVDLITMHEDLVRTMRRAASIAGDHDDVVTEDMLTARLAFHEKALWMLRAIATD